MDGPERDGGEGRRSSGLEAERRLVLDAIMEGRVSSRPEISRSLGIRSTTVSEIIGALIRTGLVAERSGRASGRGRPPSLLLGHSGALTVVVLHVVSQSLRAKLVDLGGRILAAHAVELPPEADHGRMTLELTGLIRRCLDSVPSGSQPCGVGFSLAGALDVQSRRWLFSSRWPRAGGLDLGQVAERFGLPVRIARNLDAELRARSVREGATENALVLHWGYGVGAAYAAEGKPINESAGRFGEIGHWRLHRAADRRCRCGGFGCLETIAALWAMQGALEPHLGPVSLDEDSFVVQARRADLLAIDAVREALEAIVSALGNLCRILFPRRVVMTGPFIANAALWSRLNEAFAAEQVFVGVEQPELVADQRSEALELEGIARPLFEARLRELLAER